MAQPATSKSPRAARVSAVASLARCFPEASPVRIPVQVARNGDVRSQPGECESTVIEFGTFREVLFACTTPLEFAEVLSLRTADGSFNIKASVVAVQYQPDQTIVAARFIEDVPNWIVKP